MANHTGGEWKAKRDPYTGRNYFIESKGCSVIAIIPLASELSKVSDSERFSNIRLIESAPVIYNALLRAHDLCLDGHCADCREVLREAIELVENDRIPENY